MLDTGAEVMTDRVARLVADIAARNGITKPIGLEDALIDVGMSSIAMVDLMLAVESAFDIMIPQPDLVSENFKSIATIERLVTRLCRPSA